MKEFIGKKVLVTTDRFFIAPDGKDYTSLYGTLKCIQKIYESLGFYPKGLECDWFYEIGDMIVMGNQVTYIGLCENEPLLEDHVYKCKE